MTQLLHFVRPVVLYFPVRFVYNTVMGAKRTDKRKTDFRKDFFRKAGENLMAVKHMLDAQPDVCFYIKDIQGRIVALNRRNCEICNVRDEFDAVGLRSDELFPPSKAKSYMDDDRRVATTGKPIVDEQNSYPADDSGNFTYKSVYPVTDRGGKIIGTMCLYRFVKNPDLVPAWHGAMKAVTRHIAEHYMEQLTTKSLAAIVGLSESTFLRLFSRTFGTSPGKYVTGIRITAARQLLETTQKTLSEIAQETGFFDHSHFAKTFRSERGITPGEYSRRHLRVTFP